jgi:hypothetical protein
MGNPFWGSTGRGPHQRVRAVMGISMVARDGGAGRFRWMCYQALNAASSTAPQGGQIHAHGGGRALGCAIAKVAAVVENGGWVGAILTGDGEECRWRCRDRRHARVVMGVAPPGVGDWG